MTENTAEKIITLRNLIIIVAVFSVLLSCKSAAVTETSSDQSGNDGPSYLGVLFTNHQKGVRIVNIYPGSPAEKAGFQTGEIITHIDRFPVGGELSFRNTIRSLKPGTEIRIRVLSEKGESVERIVITEKLPADQLQFPQTIEPPSDLIPYR